MRAGGAGALAGSRRQHARNMCVRDVLNSVNTCEHARSLSKPTLAPALSPAGTSHNILDMRNTHTSAFNTCKH